MIFVFTLGSTTFPTVSSAPPTPMSYHAPPLVPVASSTPEEQRSEAVGSDSRYNPGAPPPTSVPFPGSSSSPSIVGAASGERSAAAGSDRKDIPPNPVSVPPPPPSNVGQPLVRNVTGSDNKVRSSRPRRPEYSDEEESVISKESEKRSHRGKHHFSPGTLCNTYFLKFTCKVRY